MPNFEGKISSMTNSRQPSECTLAEETRVSDRLLGRNSSYIGLKPINTIKDVEVTSIKRKKVGLKIKKRKFKRHFSQDLLEESPVATEPGDHMLNHLKRKSTLNNIDKSLEAMKMKYLKNDQAENIKFDEKIDKM